jgi:hypothetical protein
MSTRRGAALFGLAGAVPTLAWALHGSGLIFDDWRYAGVVHFQGPWHLFSVAATKNPGRPGQGAYFASTYWLFGTHPALHALALALLNGVAAALVFVVGDRLWDRRVAIASTVAWVALPNRGSTRLWFSTAPSVVSLCLLLLAILLLTRDRVWLAAAALTAAVLTYESVVAIGVFALVLWGWRSGAGTWRRVALALVPVLAATIYIATHSPKQPHSPDPLGQLPTLAAADVGRAVFGSPLGARVAEGVLLVVLAVAFYRALAPSVAGWREGTLALTGVGLVGLGAAPFLAIRFPFATDGIFDRGNLVPDLGVALVFGAVICMLVGNLPRVVAVVVAAGIVAVPAYLNTQDLHDYRRATRDGRRLEAHVEADVPRATRDVLIGPPLPARGGVAQFVSSEISVALDLHWHQTGSRAHMACTTQQFVHSAEPVRYDRLTRTLTRRVGPAPPDAVPPRSCQ